MNQNQNDYIIGQFQGTTYNLRTLDVQHGFLWDSVTIPPCEMTGFVYDFFTTTIGQTDLFTPTPKKIDDTNMVMARRLPVPEAFALQRLLFTFSKEASEKDVMNIAENCVFRFDIGYKYYLQCPIGLLPCQRREFQPLRVCGKCRTIYLGDSDCPSCGTGLRLLPLPGNKEIGRQFFLDLLINLVIDNQATFYASIVANKTIKLEGKVRMWCHLEGLHARGVQ